MNKQSLGIIGIGAFGEFMLHYLSPYFANIKTYDPNQETNSLEEVCTQDIIIYSAPVQVLEKILKEISPLIADGTLFIDVCSVKVKPSKLVREYLSDDVEILGLHPLFGPQTGKDGIEGLDITLCDVRSERAECVQHFLEDTLKLNVIVSTPEEHDQDMAYAMGVSHMVAKVFTMMDIPDTKQTTKTYALLRSMVDVIKDDSDELFQAIQEENPYVEPIKEKFFTTVEKLEKKLSFTEL